jgi:hypothetical protein
MFWWGGLFVFGLSSGAALGADWTIQRLTNTPGDSGSPKVAVAGASVYVVWRDDKPGNNEIYLRRSEDGGATWRGAQRLTYNAGSSETPAIAAEGSKVYVVWADATPAVPQIYFRRSTDGGKHWQAAQALTNNSSAKAGKPAVAVAGSSLYVVWHNDKTASASHCWVACKKSVNGGVTWQAAKTLSDEVPSPDSRNPSIAADGNGVYVAWESLISKNKEIFFRRSKNGGAAWETPQRLTTNSGASAAPSIAVMSPSVFVAWEDATPGNAEIYVRKSANKGATWAPELRLTTDAAQSRAPALAVRSSSIYAVWNDDSRGNDELFLRKSTNGGADWEDVERLTTNAGSSKGQAPAASGTKVFVAWQDASPGNNEIYLMHKEPALDAIAIVSPTASTTWVKGEKAEIRWRITEGAADQASEPADQPGFVFPPEFAVIDKVKIDLYDGPALKMPIVAETAAGSGKFSWLVPASLPDGTKYKVRIACSTDPRIFKDSPSFRIGDAALPDLVLDSVTRTPASPSTASSITVTAVVRNAGNAPAGKSYTSYRVSGQSYYTYYYVPPLEAGATATVTGHLGPYEAGTYQLRVTADNFGDVAESNETNNEWFDSFTVTTLPDLVVDSLTHSPTSPTTVTAITATAIVKNNGNAPAGATYLSMNTKEKIEYFAIPALAVGATSSVTWNIGTLAAGTYQVVATADFYGTEAELNEWNNVKLESFNVLPAPDLVVTDVIGVINPNTNQGVFQVIVKNQGLGPAGASRLGGTVTMSTLTIDAWEIDVKALAPNETFFYTKNFTSPALPKSSLVTFLAHADVTNVVPETNESNNIRSYIWITPGAEKTGSKKAETIIVR